MHLLGLAFGLGCGASTPGPAPITERFAEVAWPEVEAESTELLQRLIRVDTSNPPGQEGKAARILERHLARPGIETFMVELAPGRSSVYARVRGTEAEAAPIVLLSHLDTVGAEPEAWPSATGPFSGVLEDDAIHGRGALGGKGLAVVHAATLILLAQANERPRRDVILISTADGTRLSGGIDQLLIMRPELLGAELVLGPGGMGVHDLFGDGRLVHAVGTSEKGFADVLLTAREDPPGQGSVSATERINRALIGIRERKSMARLTAPVELTLSALAESTAFPRDLALKSKLFAQIFELGGLKAGSYTRTMVTDTLRVSELSATGPAGLSPARATARLRAELLADTDPARLKQELRLAIDDPRVHLNILRGEPATSSPTPTRLLEIIRRHVSTRDSRKGVVVPVQSAWASDLRVLRRQGVPAYGYVPFEVSVEELEAQQGRRERLRVGELSRGIGRMLGIVLDLSLAPPGDRG